MNRDNFLIKFSENFWPQGHNKKKSDMAKYKLTVTSWYEDNEQAGDNDYNQQYAQGTADAMLDYWERSEVELQINGGPIYRANAQGGPRKPEDYRKTKWPWVLASEMLPKDGQHCVIYYRGNWTEAWYHTTDGSCSEDERHFWVDDNIGGYPVTPDEFYETWWRTIEAPEGV